LHDPQAIPWVRRGNAPPLPPGEIHVWLLGPPSDDGRERLLEALLDPSERARAEAFVFERHRLAFVLAHGHAREVLAGYLQTTPEAIEFDSLPGGKPRLTDRCLAGRLPLRFNLSHSGDTALLAVALDREVGVDVERVRSLTMAREIAARQLGSDVAATLEGLEGRALDAAFLAAWTRHEAVLKARGAGLFDPGCPQDVAGWQVVQLDAGPTMAAAVAFQRGPVRLGAWMWMGRPEED